MRPGLLTKFGVFAIAAAILAGPVNASEAPTEDAANWAEEAGSGEEATPVDTELAPQYPAAMAPNTEEAFAVTPPAPGVTLGEIGYDEQGMAGRIHVVVTGDTLWDISDAYLGTPWVWPSVWIDNQEIENPHLIVPDDRIWITGHEMRRVSQEEADAMLARQPVEEEIAQPAAAAAPLAAVVIPEAEIEAPSDLPRRFIRIASRETSGFLSSERLESSASIVDSVPARLMLSEPDQVYIGLGDRDVAVGDEFTVLRTANKIFDPDTNRLLGYYIDVLGWVKVDETHADTSVATIQMSVSEIVIGDRIVPREDPLLDIEIGPSPEGVDGRISFFPAGRVVMGEVDFVYLNRGQLDGLAVGSPLEVYRRGWKTVDVTRNAGVLVPDRVIATLIVVRAQSETAVAMVTHSQTEIVLGDSFRGAVE